MSIFLKGFPLKREYLSGIKIKFSPLNASHYTVLFKIYVYQASVSIKETKSINFFFQFLIETLFGWQTNREEFCVSIHLSIFQSSINL